MSLKMTGIGFFVALCFMTIFLNRRSVADDNNGANWGVTPPESAFQFFRLRGSGVAVFQDGGQSFSWGGSWNPSYALNEENELSLHFGLSVLAGRGSKYFTAYETMLEFSEDMNRHFAWEIHTGVHYWADNGGVLPVIGFGWRWYLRQYTPIIDYVWASYTHHFRIDPDAGSLVNFKTDSWRLGLAISF